MMLAFLVLLYTGSVLAQSSSNTDGDVRLVDGNTTNEGRVEIYNSGTWGTVCDDLWNDRDAVVVCRQLGLNSAGAQGLRGAHFGEGSGPITLDNVRCLGNETRLMDCPSRPIYRHNCAHSEDASVVCGPAANEGDLRLVDGNTTNEGRVEMYFSGRWGTVCDDFWDNRDAAVVCRQLGLPWDSAQGLQTAHFGQGSDPIVLDDVQCVGNESRLIDCQASTTHNCGHHEDASVSCQSSNTDGDVRLVDGNTTNEGRVEIYNSGTWGTVCDDLWNDRDAVVVCRQLGLNSQGAQGIRGAHFGEGSGPITLDNVRCSGNESRLMDCPSRPIYRHNCAHSEDASVVCGPAANEGDLRLADSNTTNEGRVEMYFSGRWGTVCDDFWDNRDAAVVCRQLGLPWDSAQGLQTAHFGQGSDPIVLDDVQCVGNESRLIDCQASTTHNCGHHEDASVSCQSSNTDGDVRLVDGNTTNEGRVEIYNSGTWGTVCDDLWNDRDAVVVCRQLGLNSQGAQGLRGAHFGEGSGPITLDNVRCSGNESRLMDCPSRPIYRHNCAHSEDASVVCGPAANEGDLRLADSNTTNEGRVEMYFSGRWGTVCDDFWDNRDAAVVCRQLGLPWYGLSSWFMNSSHQ